MTTPVPTGQVRTTDNGGRELVYLRTFRAPIEDVWASITEPDRTARWFARWSGEASPGKTVDLELSAEDGQPTGKMIIEECRPPTLLRVVMVDEAGRWNIAATLRESGGVTELEFVHRSEADVSVGDIGPGWEWYLDRLTASREGAPLPEFDDYYPAQKEYFESQTADA